MKLVAISVVNNFYDDNCELLCLVRSPAARVNKDRLKNIIADNPGHIGYHWVKEILEVSYEIPNKSEERKEI